jgi:hypothetical protein
MDANLGGTEMLGALQTVFRTRRWDVPTCVFVLTDGGVSSQGHEYIPTKIGNIDIQH